MVARVVMGVAKEAVTVPRVDTPADRHMHIHTDAAGPQWVCDG